MPDPVRRAVMVMNFRSSAARDLVTRIKDAGGQVERLSKGRLKVTGPTGSLTIHEPAGETRRDLRRSSADRLIAERTGLKLGEGS
jgi:hypothetical protein